MTAGMIQMHVSVKIDMTELEKMSPDRITAILVGISKVVAANATPAPAKDSP